MNPLPSAFDDGIEAAAMWHIEEAKRIQEHWEEHKDKYIRAGGEAVLFVAEVMRWHANAATAIRAIRPPTPA